MSEERATNIGRSGIDVVYESFGDVGSPPVLLMMGGGAQMINWPEGFCQELVSRRLHVIRFDNRDAGLSTHHSNVPAPDLRAAMAGDYSTAPYTLSDMAADTVGLVDFLNIDSAHLVGASLGGTIAQTIAIEYPRPGTFADLDDVHDWQSGRRPAEYGRRHRDRRTTE